MTQLKDAMYSILRDMKGEDMINLIFFNDQVTSSRAVYATRRSQEYAIGYVTLMKFCQLDLEGKLVYQKKGKIQNSYLEVFSFSATATF